MITKKDVEHIARLARLRLTEAEKELYLEQLNKILGYMEKLNQLDTNNIEPTYHVLPKKNVFRLDAVQKSLSQEEALANCPNRDETFFIVPAVIEE